MTPFTSLLRAANDVRINTRRTVPAGFLLESRQSVTGVSVTQASERAALF